jgi:hypothetical protein
MNQRSSHSTYTQSGTFRKGRVLPALWATSAPIDERTPEELLNYLLDLASNIPFYNLNNEPAHHNWELFFKNDISFALAKIAVYDLNAIEKKLIDNSTNLNHAKHTDRKEAKIQQFKDDTIQLINEFEHWYHIASELEGSYETISAIAQSTQSMASDWQDWIRISFEETNHKLLHPDTPSELFQRIKIFLDKEASLIAAPQENIEERTGHFRFIYRLFYRAISTVVNFAQKEFPKTLLHQGHTPPAAMLISFLQLFKFNQQHLNQFTKRHLDYYYYNILGAKHEKAQPDFTYLSLLLSEGHSTYQLKAGTQFSAGIDEKGIETLYHTQKDVLLSRANIQSVKTLFMEMDPDVDLGSSYRLASGLYCAADAWSQDGFGQPFETDHISWPPFGESPADNRMHRLRTRAAEIGFCIASHIFLLGSGKRSIFLNLKFSAASYGKFKLYIEDIALNKNITFNAAFLQLFGNAFHISLSGAEGWIENLDYHIETNNDADQNNIKIEIILDERQPSIVPNPTLQHQNRHLSEHWPVMRVLLKKVDNVFVYSLLEILNLSKIDIDVKVEGLKQLLLFNEFGQLNVSSPYLPFGPLPKRQSYLLFGSAELSIKKLVELNIQIDWFDLPDQLGGFDAYYENYPYDLGNDQFIVSFSALNNYHFQPKAEERQVFHLFSWNELGTLSKQSALANVNLNKLDLSPDYSIRELDAFTTNSQSGFFRIELVAPGEAFGHRVYPQLFADVTVKNVNRARPRLFRKPAPPHPLPSEPYTPKVKSLSIDYSASTSLQFEPTKFRENERLNRDTFTLLHPFGIEQSFKDGIAGNQELIPSFEERGQLLIGLKGLDLPLPIHLFFKLKNIQQEGSITNPSKLVMYYLSDNRWTPFNKEDILSDGTHAFTATGILTLKLPKNIKKGNTILDSHLYWIRIAFKELNSKINEVELLTTNALKVFWMPNEQASHFNLTATRSKITELKQRNNAIESLIQLENFQGGRAAENQNEFYTRISERLRHKGRAIDSWDYEHLILEAFPEVSQVKCIGHNQYRMYNPDKNNLIKPGEVYVVVVPTMNSLTEPIKGDKDLLKKVEDFLYRVCSPTIKLKVIFPEFEQIRINGNVVFEEATTPGIMLDRLLRDIARFICPWTVEDILPLGEQLSIHEIFRFIESRPYVRFFTKFSMIHLINEQASSYDLKDSTKQGQGSDVIRPSHPWVSILPLPIQGISIIDSEEYQSPEQHTMDKMYMDNDAIVSPSRHENKN